MFKRRFYETRIIWGLVDHIYVQLCLYFSKLYFNKSIEKKLWSG